MKNLLFLSVLLMHQILYAVETPTQSVASLQLIAFQATIDQATQSIREAQDRIIEAIKETTNPAEAIYKVYVSWLNQKARAPIIVNQTGLEVFQKMGFLESDIPEEWKQLLIDISKYIIPDSSIKDWQNRPWTTEYLVANQYFPPPHDGVLIIGMTGVSILDASKIPDANTVVELNCAEGSLRFIVPGSFKQLDKLTELYLFSNHLRSIVSGTFDGLSALLILNLDDNNMSSIALGAFAPLVKLNKLSLNKNPELKLKQPDNLAAIKSERPEWFITP